MFQELRNFSEIEIFKSMFVKVIRHCGLIQHDFFSPRLESYSSTFLRLLRALKFVLNSASIDQCRDIYGSTWHSLEMTVLLIESDKSQSDLRFSIKPCTCLEWFISIESIYSKARRCRISVFTKAN